MKRVQYFGVAVLAVLAFSAFAAAGSASALTCATNPIFVHVPTKYTTQEACELKTPVEILGTWILAQLFHHNGTDVTGTMSVDSTTPTGKGLELEDMGTGVKISCEGTDEGTIGPEGKDEETTVTENLASCKVLAGSGTCKKILAVKAINLPWHTQLEESRDVISSSGAGTPGWLVECEGFLGIKVDDSCTLEEGSTAVKNLEAGTLETVFDAESGEANCSVGGEKQGLVIGAVIILLTNGESLSVS